MATHVQNVPFKSCLTAFVGVLKKISGQIIPQKIQGQNRAFIRLIFYARKEMTELSIKKQSIKSLSDGISKFENNKNILKNSDFSDFKQFLKTYLNTSEPKKRKKLAEEFRKRHLELYEFLKDNQELVSAETEISKTVNAVLSGDTASSDDKQLTNLFEIIEGGMKK